MSNAQKAQDFVTSFMKNLAEGVELTSSLQAVFAKILAEQVVVDADTNVVSFKPVFSTLLKVLTYIATPEDKRPEAGSSYTQEAIDTAADSAATETGLTVGEEIPTEAPSEEPTEAPSEEPTDPELPEGETFTLTTGDDVIAAPLAEGEEAVEGVVYATENNDTIKGAVDTLASRTTFDRQDQIDGGEGEDKLELTLKSDFRGFQNDGFMKNVEIVEITNDSNANRKFSGEGVAGVETYILNPGDRRIELEKLAKADIEVQVNGQKTGDLKIGFATTAVSGQSDSLKLTLNQVGADEIPNTCGKNDGKDAEFVKLDTNGIENLTVASTGAATNYVNLFDTTSGVHDLALEGSADLNLGMTNSAASLRTFDTTDLTGNLWGTKLEGLGQLTSITLGDADHGIEFADLTRLESVKLGDGNNDITLAGTGSRKLNTIEMGEGNDAVTVASNLLLGSAKITAAGGANHLTLNTATARSLALELEGVQTLTASGDAELTLSGQNFADLTRINQSSDKKLTLAEMQTEELTLRLNANGEVVYDGSGLLIVETDAGSANELEVNCAGVESIKASSTPTRDNKVTTTQAEEVVLNVRDYSTFTGELVAVAAETITLNVASATGITGLDSDKVKEFKGTTNNGGDEKTNFQGTITANQAASMVINAEGNVGTDGAGNDATITSATLESLVASFYNDGQITLETDNLNEINLQRVEGDFKIHEDSTLSHLVSLNAHVTGSLNVAAGLDRLEELTLSGTGSSFTLAESGKSSSDVNINASAFLGTTNITLAAYENDDNDAAGNATIFGSDIGANIITVNGKRDDLIINGGVSDDQVEISVDAFEGGFVLEGNLGLGNDFVTLNIANLAALDDKTLEMEFNLAVQGPSNTVKFVFGQATDTVKLNDSSSLKGYSTLIVQEGTVDISELDLEQSTVSNTTLVIGSGIKLSVAQLANVKEVIATSAGAKIEVAINSAEEQAQLQEALTRIEVKAGGDKADDARLAITATPGSNAANDFNAKKATEALTTASTAADTARTAAEKQTLAKAAKEKITTIEENLESIIQPPVDAPTEAPTTEPEPEPEDAVFTATETLAVTGNNDAEAHVMEIDLGKETFTVTTEEAYTLTVGTVTLTAEATANMTTAELITALTTDANEAAYGAADFTIAAGTHSDGAKDAIVITWNEEGPVTPGTVSLASDTDFSTAAEGAEVTAGQDETFTATAVTIDLADGTWDPASAELEAGYIFKLTVGGVDGDVIAEYTVEASDTLVEVAAGLIADTTHTTNYTVEAVAGEDSQVEVDVADASQLDSEANITITLTGMSAADWIAL